MFCVIMTHLTSIISSRQTLDIISGKLQSIIVVQTMQDILQHVSYQRAYRLQRERLESISP